MQRRTKAVCAGLFAAYAFLPALRWLCRIFGVSVTFRYGFILGALLLAAAGAAAVLLRRYDKNGEFIIEWFLLPLPLLALVNWLLLLMHDDIKIRGSGSADLLPVWDFALLCIMLVSFVLCVYIRSRYINHGWVRTGSVVVPLVIVALVTLTLLPLCLLGNIGETTVVDVFPSPDGRYYAELIDDDQGALGGNTCVDVYRTAELDLGVIRFCSVPKQVYWGNYGEFNDMTIEWKDNETLLINGKEYPIG